MEFGGFRMPIYPQSGEGTVNGLIDDEQQVPAGGGVQPPIARTLRVVDERPTRSRRFRRDGRWPELRHPSSSLGRVKKRVDVLLVERGLAESRAQAQALVLAGLVPGHDKPGEQLDESAVLRVERPPRFVSRGGEKLQHALDSLDVLVEGRDCADVGASTGGFTDCLLQAGAKRVVAIDVGYGQLHPRVRADPRVTVLERTNARSLTELPFAPELVVCDVSFISVAKALPPVLALAASGWDALVLVKPQFEAGRADVGKGVVRDPDVQRKVLENVIEAAREWGGDTTGVVDSGLLGPKGNREFFVHLRNRGTQSHIDDIDRWIAEAVG